MDSQTLRVGNDDGETSAAPPTTVIPDKQSASGDPSQPTSTASDSNTSLADAILSRLATEKEGTDDDAPDHRVHHTGARAKGLDACWQAFAKSGAEEASHTLHLTAALSDLDNINARGLVFGDHASFRSATFGERANFSSASFGDRADFRYANFGERATFSSATFSKLANFSSATFGDSAFFSSATFGDSADFSSANFGDRAYFKSATFGERADFETASFGDHAGFRSATFGERANFLSATFGDGAYFYSATFGDRADFGDATFGNRADFYSATFGDSAYFLSATFGDSAEFYSATFGDRANFLSATFGANASFPIATFGDNAIFHEAVFGDGAYFYSATFGDRTGFTEAEFLGRAHFEAAEFKGYVAFKSARWNDATHYGGAFEGARFRDVADFKTSNFHAFAAFDSAKFDRHLLLSDPSHSTKPDDIFATACRAVTCAVDNDLEAAAADNDNATPHDTLKKEALEQRWSELSGGYRTAKIAMKDQGDFEREQRYYRFEVKARLNKPSTTRWEKAAAWFYDKFSDYGASIGRPLGGLAASTFLIFFPLYMFIGLTFTQTKAVLPISERPPCIIHLMSVDDVFDAANFSMGVTFRPFLALSGKSNGKPEIEQKLGDRILHKSGLVSTLTHLLVILQSLISVILAFLFALAVRRKFQIN